MAKRPFDFYRLELSDKTLAQRKALVAKHGVDVRSVYGDTFWTETMAERSKTALAFAKWLLDAGQAIDADTGRGSAIEIAATSGNLKMVGWLIESGAKVPGTLLETVLGEASNTDLEAAVPIVEALLEGGTKITTGAKKQAARAYASFDYARDAMAPAFRKKCEADALRLCKLMKVEPPAPHVRHDGTSAIRVSKGTLAKQFEALWDFLVPASGSASTLQGEIVRVAGRINHELGNNGGGNWDAYYREQAKSFPRLIARGTPVDARQIATATVFCKSPRDQDNANVLCEIAVAWVRANPTPIPFDPRKG